tara:strand:- start:1382 stop:3409 length:2028 start_codon:yes stop_codon:yes gene_type:complete
MATIFVEGLGEVEIQGNTPNAEEQQAIAKALGQETQQTTNVVEEQQDPNFLQSVGKGLTDRSTSLAAGGMAGFAKGATAGTLMGGVVGGAVGGLAGGVLGAAGGGQVYDIFESFIRGEELNLDDTSKQAFQDIKREAMFNMGAMSLPGLKPAITRLLLKKDKGQLVAKDVKQLKEAGDRIGVDIFPFDVMGKFGNLYSKVAGVFPITGNPIKNAAAKRGETLNNVRNQILNDLAPNTHLSELGVKMFNAAKNSSKEFNNVASIMYKEFYDQAASINKKFIPTQQIKKTAQSAIDDFLTKRPTAITTKTVKGKKVKVKSKIPANVNKKYEAYINQLSNLEDFITPAQVKQIKQDLAEFSSVIAGKDGGGVFKLTKIAKSADASLRNFNNYNMSAFANDPNVTPQTLQKLIQKLQIADKFYANGIQLYGRSTAQKFTKADRNIFVKGFNKPGSIEPDEIFKAVVKTGSPQSLDDLRTLIGQENFESVARKVIDGAFKKASVRGDKLRGLLFNPVILEEELGLAGKNASDLLKNITKGTRLDSQRLEDLINVSKYHANLDIPDVSSFVARRATLGGARSILGGVAMGAGVLSSPVAAIPLIYMTNRTSAFLANPKNIDLAITALDITAPRQLKYIASAQLLKGLIKSSQNEDEKQFFLELQDVFRDQKEFIIDNMRVE